MRSAYHIATKWRQNRSDRVIVKRKSNSGGKKVKRCTSFSEKYTEKYSFIKPGLSDSQAEICATSFGCAHGGLNDVVRHVEGTSHKKRAEERERQSKLVKSNKKILDLFPASSGRSQVSNQELSVMRAETYFVDAVVEMNLPMASLDTFSKLVKKAFRDSKIAQSFQCARSKGTAVAKELAAKITLALAERMKLGPFTLSTDGSNDSGSSKLFPLVVRTVNPDTEEVRSDALSVPAIEGSASRENIFRLVESELTAHGIPWSNCLALGCDNANVMVGKESGLYGRMLKEHPQLYLSGCVCHLIHIAAEHGAGCFPFSPSQLLVDVYYYLEKSSKRLSALKVIQVMQDIEEQSILKHVSTRWLSIGKCLPRLVDSWDALYTFFKQEEKDALTSVAKKKTGDLKTMFQSCTNKLYCLFLLDAISVFEAINTKLQCDAPMVHVLKPELEKFFKNLLLRFVKPSAMLYKSGLDVDFMSPYNVQTSDSLIIGDRARAYIRNPENKLKEEKIQDFNTCVVKFFQVSCSYLKKKLPFSDPLLLHARVADPARQVECTFSNIDYFLTRFPILGEGVSTTDLMLEFSRYQSTDIRQCIKDRADATWWAVSQVMEEGQLVFKYLPKVMMAILTIPHSSAHCERAFSVVRHNKTAFRGSMDRDTLEAIVVCKSRPGSALQRDYGERDLKDLKSAYSRSLQPRQ